MAAIGKLKEKSAFKVYAKSQMIDFATTNAITASLEEYEKALKYDSEDDFDDEDDKIELNVYDYIPKEYHQIYDYSKKYQGIIDSISPHACGFCLSNLPLSRGFGLMKVKDQIVTLIEGSIADSWGYVKNDLLAVSVWGIIGNVFKRIGKPIMTVNELLEITKDDKETWDIYRNGFTININQYEGNSSRTPAMKYEPINVSEITAFTAAVRPSFKTLFSKFVSRENFDYGIKTLDNLLQTPNFPYSYVLYQENIMSVLQHAGIPATSSYEVIKAISKKKTKVIEGAKISFIDGFKKALMNDDKSLTPEKADATCMSVWEIIENASAYGFNASHAYCVAIDSLYGAYLKAHYPYEFYEVVLEFYSDKKDADKVSKIIAEMKAYKDIHLGELKYGNDNRKYTADPENKTIHSSLKGVKYINDEVKEFLWFLSETYKEEIYDFPSLYEYLGFKLNKRHIETLIKIGYFKDFGTQLKMIKWITYSNEMFDRKQYRLESLVNMPNTYSFLSGFALKQTDKTLYIDEETKPILKRKLYEIMPNEEFSFVERVKNEVELMGELKTEMPDGVTVGVVQAMSYKKPVFLFKSWKNGKEVWVNLDSRKNMPKRGAIVLLYNLEQRQVGRRMNVFAEVELIKEA